MKPNVHRRALSRAIEIVGGKDRLAVYLGAERQQLAKWLGGKARPPVQVLQCVSALLRYTMLERATRKTAAKSRRRRRGRSPK
jgi:hypothetical protein